MVKIEISDKAYKELKDNMGNGYVDDTGSIEGFASLMIRSGVHRWKELMEQLPEEF